MVPKVISLFLVLSNLLWSCYSTLLKGAVSAPIPPPPPLFFFPLTSRDVIDSKHQNIPNHQTRKQSMVWMNTGYKYHSKDTHCWWKIVKWRRQLLASLWVHSRRPAIPNVVNTMTAFFHCLFSPSRFWNDAMLLTSRGLLLRTISCSRNMNVAVSKSIVTRRKYCKVPHLGTTDKVGSWERVGVWP